MKHVATVRGDYYTDLETKVEEKLQELQSAGIAICRNCNLQEMRQSMSHLVDVETSLRKIGLRLFCMSKNNETALDLGNLSNCLAMDFLTSCRLDYLRHATAFWMNLKNSNDVKPMIFIFVTSGIIIEKAQSLQLSQSGISVIPISFLATSVSITSIPEVQHF